jgi:hypothetical protein
VRAGSKPSAGEVIRLPMPDKQASALRAISTPDPEKVAIISDVFGEEMLNHRDKVNAILTSQHDVYAQTMSLLDSALNIGRAVFALSDQLALDEYRLLMANTDKVYGLSRGIVSQLVTLSQQIDTGRLRRDSCPRTYSVGYQFATLDDRELEEAIAIGLYRPDVTRREVIEFKAKLKPEKAVAPTPLRTLTARRDRLLARRHDLQQQMDAMQVEIDQVEALITKKKGRV